MHSTEVLQQPVRSHNPAHLQPGEEEEDGESLGTCSGSPFCACAGFTVFSRQNFHEAALVLSHPEAQSWAWLQCPQRCAMAKGQGWGQGHNEVPHGIFTFHPVALKVFPALPTITVRSHIPCKLAGNERRETSMAELSMLLSGLQ